MEILKKKPIQLLREADKEKNKTISKVGREVDMASSAMYRKYKAFEEIGLIEKRDKICKSRHIAKGLTPKGKEVLESLNKLDKVFNGKKKI